MHVYYYVYYILYMKATKKRIYIPNGRHIVHSFVSEHIKSTLSL